MEVLGSNGSRDGRGVSALDVGGVWGPTGGAEGGIVQNRGVDTNEALTDAVLDVGQVRGAQLVENKAREGSQQLSQKRDSSMLHERVAVRLR